MVCSVLNLFTVITSHCNHALIGPCHIVIILTCYNNLLYLNIDVPTTQQAHKRRNRATTSDVTQLMLYWLCQMF